MLQHILSGGKREGLTLGSDSTQTPAPKSQDTPLSLVTILSIRDTVSDLNGVFVPAAEPGTAGTGLAQLGQGWAGTGAITPAAFWPQLPPHPLSRDQTQGKTSSPVLLELTCAAGAEGTGTTAPPACSEPVWECCNPAGIRAGQAPLAAQQCLWLPCPTWRRFRAWLSRFGCWQGSVASAESETALTDHQRLGKKELRGGTGPSREENTQQGRRA